MRYIKDLTEKEIKDLSYIEKSSKYNYQEKNRAKSILLSYKGYSIPKLTDIFGVTKLTIYNWFNSWKDEGIKGLYNKEGKGRKKIYSEEEEKIIIKIVEENSRNIKQVLVEVNKKTSKSSSDETIKRILDRNSFIWKRIKRVPKGKPDEEVYKKN